MSDDFMDLSDIQPINKSAAIDLSDIKPITGQSSKSNKGIINDTLVGLGKGVMQIPGAITGLADIQPSLLGINRPFDKMTDAIGQATGFQPSKWAKDAESAYSPQMQQARQNVNQVWDDPNTNGLDVAKAYALNPRAIMGTVVESAPSMLAGGLLGRAATGLGALSKTGTAAEIAKRAALAGNIGEGAIMAGQSMENIDDSVDPQKAALASLGTGVIGGVIGNQSNRIANKFGLADIDAIAAGGVRAGMGDVNQSLARRVIGGAIQEGPIEEGLQSIGETGLQNFAEDKPLTEGMGRNFVEGSLAGSLMGGGANAVSGPLSRAANQAPIINQQQGVNDGQLPESSVTTNGGNGAAFDGQEQALVRPVIANTGQAEAGTQKDTVTVANVQPEQKPAYRQPNSGFNPQGGVDGQSRTGSVADAVQGDSESSGKESRDTADYRTNARLAEGGTDGEANNPQPTAASQELNTQRNTDNGLPKQTLSSTDSGSTTERANPTDLQDRGAVDAAQPTPATQEAQSAAPGAGADTTGTVAADAETKAKPVEAFTPTHKLNDGYDTPVVQTEDGYQDADGFSYAPDEDATPIKGAINESKENQTTEDIKPDSVKETVDVESQQKPAQQDEAGNILLQQANEKPDGVLTAPKAPQSTQRGASGNNDSLTADPILTKSKGAYLIGKSLEFSRANPKAIPAAKKQNADKVLASYDDDLNRALAAAPFDVYAKHPSNAKIKSESILRQGYEALRGGDTETVQVKAKDERKVQLKTPQGAWQYVTDSPEGLRHTIYSTNALTADKLEYAKSKNPDAEFRVEPYSPTSPDEAARKRPSTKPNEQTPKATTVPLDKPADKSRDAAPSGTGAKRSDVPEAVEEEVTDTKQRDFEDKVAADRADSERANKAIDEIKQHNREAASFYQIFPENDNDYINKEPYKAFGLRVRSYISGTGEKPKGVINTFSNKKGGLGNSVQHEKAQKLANEFNAPVAIVRFDNDGGTPVGMAMVQMPAISDGAYAARVSADGYASDISGDSGDYLIFMPKKEVTTPPKPSTESQLDTTKTEIGKGNSGKVYRVGDEIEKNSTNDEAKVYAALRGVDGIAKGYEQDGKIRVPFYKHIISTDEISSDQRSGMSGIISKNVTRINRAVSALIDSGYSYNEPYFQFGMNDDQTVDLIDFSNADNKNPDEALKSNLETLARTYRVFGVERVSKAVSQVNEVLWNQYHHVKWGGNALLGDEFDGVNYKELSDRLDGKKAENAYYTTNARYVNLKDTAQTDNIDGVKTVLSIRPLTEQEISGWELVPVYTSKDTTKVKLADKAEIIEHTTVKGKVLRGIVRTDLTKAEAQEIDKYTFKKDDGWFIREKNLTGELPAQKQVSERPATQVKSAAEKPKVDVAKEKQIKAANRLRTVAQSMQDKAREEQNRDRNTNTSKRAREAGQSIEKALKDEALAKTAINIADAIERGDAPALSGLTSMAQVEQLNGILNNAMFARDSKRFETWGEREKHKGRKPEKDDIIFARYPQAEIHESNISGFKVKLRAIRGGKTLADSIYGRTINQEQYDKLKKLVGQKEADYMLGWYPVDQLKASSRLQRMGINGTTDLENALSEYVTFKEGKQEEDKVKAAERALVGQNHGVDFFPTPKALAERMATLAGINPGMRVLEPSAGNGNLADAAKASGGNVDAIEISSALRNVLDAKGYNVVAHDFSNYTPDEKYDAVIMNPPFSNSQDAEHIQRAFDMLNPGGKLVAIAGEGVFFRSDKNATAFREWLDENNAEVEKLPANTFQDKTLLNTTGANARLIVIDKPESGDNRYSKSTSVTGSTVADIRAMLPARVNKLVAAGKLVVVQGVEDLPKHINALYHTAWHGSPHDHNKFDSSKIGTGEGAHAYGYGHYFTDVKDIAEWYRDKLTGGYANSGVNTVKVNGQLLKDYLAGIPTSHMVTKNRVGTLLEKAGTVEKAKELGEQQRAANENSSPAGKEKVNKIYEEVQRVLDGLLGATVARAEPNRGKLYQVELAPTQDEYLDWDKPLSDQSDTVKRALKPFNFKDSMTGEDIHLEFALHENNPGYDGAASELRSIGIRGIRYKTSEGKSEASNYVIFDDNDISITAKYSQLDGVEALYDGKSDKLYLVADMLNKDNLSSVLAHELIHRGEAQDPKLKAAIGRFESDLSRRFDLAARGIGTKAEIAAYKRVIAAETPAKDQASEFRAYMISEYMRSPDSFTGKVKQVFADFIASIRAFLIRNNLDFGYIKSLTPADLAALSKYGAAVHRQGVDNKILSQLASVYRWEGTAQEYDQQFYDGAFSEDGKKPGARFENKYAAKDETNTKPVSKAKPSEAGGVRYSKSMDSAIVTEAKRKAGLGPKKTLSQAITDILQRGISANFKALQQRWEELKPQLEQGIFDKFYGIKLAEQEILGDVAHSLSGYISARLSTGSSSTMQALLLHGAPQWADGIIQKKDGSKGFAEMLQPVKDDLENFTAWMVGRRADRLYREGKENNFSRDEIDALLALKQDSYQGVADDIAAMNSAVLDLAQDAGLVDPESRKLFENADYIPFYRLVEGKQSGPGKKGGLTHQNSGIKMLKGSDNPMSDPLGNMMQNWAHLIDASMKNDALNKTLMNLDGSRFITGIPRVEFKQALIPKEQVKKLMLESGLPKEIVDAMPADLTTGIAKMWQMQAPTDPDVVRVMRDGKSEYYKVNDAMLLTSLTAVNQMPFGGIFKPMRYMKQLLTGAVTADPTFMARNFIRDSMHSWTIAEEKGFKLGLDSIHGAVKSFKEEGGYIDMMFAGASFQGGYGNYNNPDAARESMDAALRRRGIKDIQGFKDSILDTPKKYWEMYRSVGDAIENASREAILENSKQAGAEKAKYLFEAKDLMDFSMQGSFTLIRAMSDMLPFFNARLIGLYRLAKAGKTPEARKMILAKGLSIAMFSLALLALNADNDDYEALEDWDKDSYFHFFFGDQHYRIPKPFELGLIFGTIPERSARALLGKDTLKEYAQRMGHGASDTLAFNPIPQMFKPFIELYANKDMFTGRAIEGMADEGKLPSARYNEYTSETMRALSAALPEALGASPKRLEHLLHGYLGALGMYALGASDMMVRQLSGMPELPASRMDSLPVLKAFYQEKPTLHTKYGTEFYDMLNEVNQIHKTINAYKKEGNLDKANELRIENADKLRTRKQLESSSKQLSKLKAQVDVVYRSNLSAEAKRSKIDALMQRSNEVTRLAVQRSHHYFN